MTFAEYKDVLDRLDGIRDKVVAIDRRLEVHCSKEEAIVRLRARYPQWLSVAAAWVAAGAALYTMVR
jgi:hypothetical protein